MQHQNFVRWSSTQNNNSKSTDQKRDWLTFELAVGLMQQTVSFRILEISLHNIGAHTNEMKKKDTGKI